MASDQLTTVYRQLRRWAGDAGARSLTDAQLLERFVRQRDEAAFELLVWRHAALVLGVCRRVLPQLHDAEDAFQATFLALVRKAGSIGKREAVASWLYKVAYRVALRARERRAKAPDRRQNGVEGIAVEPVDELAWRELTPVIDAEVDRLPARYRTPFILCYLQGKTNAEAAALLGCPRGTIATRLSRARALLRGRLVRRGVTLSAGLFGTLVAQEALAAVPAVLVDTAVRASLAYAAGANLAAGLVSTQAATLAQGVLKTMFLAKLKVTAVVCLALGVLGTSTGFVTYQAYGQAQGDSTAPGKKSSAAGQSASTPEELRKQVEELRKELLIHKTRADKALSDSAVAREEAAQERDRARVIAEESRRLAEKLKEENQVLRKQMAELEDRLVQGQRVGPKEPAGAPQGPPQPLRPMQIDAPLGIWDLFAMYDSPEGDGTPRVKISLDFRREKIMLYTGNRPALAEEIERSTGLRTPVVQWQIDYQIDTNKLPTPIDLAGVDFYGSGQRQSLFGIIAVAGDEMWLCYGTPGSGRPKEFKRGAVQVLMKLQRTKPISGGTSLKPGAALSQEARQKLDAARASLDEAHAAVAQADASRQVAELAYQRAFQRLEVLKRQSSLAPARDPDDVKRDAKPSAAPLRLEVVATAEGNLSHAVLFQGNKQIAAFKSDLRTFAKDLGEARQKLGPDTVTLFVDQRLAYSHVVKLTELCKDAGFRSLEVEMKK